MKTAMQELIDELKLIEAYPMSPLVLKMAEDLLEKEKQEIAIAYNNGIKNPYTNIWVQLPQRETTRGEIYYEERYKQTK
jgi:hypothetical protein